MDTALEDALITDIIRYINMLNQRMELSVSIHQVETRLDRGWDRLVHYNMHTNPLCMCIKANVNVVQQCVMRQFDVTRLAAKRAFFGMCWAGVSEFVFPVKDLNGQAAGFIAVGGYLTRPEEAARRIRSLAAQYGQNEEQLLVLLNLLRTNVPDMQTLSALIRPLADMLTLLLHINEELRDFRRLDGGGGNPLYGEMLRFIQENYQNSELCLGDLSRRFGCSASHISHLFGQYAGCTLKSVINTYRVDSARRLLENTNMTVQQIAYAIGFSDASYFSYIFHNKVGVSPREYRKKHPEPR